MKPSSVFRVCVRYVPEYIEVHTNKIAVAALDPTHLAIVRLGIVRLITKRATVAVDVRPLQQVGTVAIERRAVGADHWIDGILKKSDTPIGAHQVIIGLPARDRVGDKVVE